jgi:hypothetical protein
VVLFTWKSASQRSEELIIINTWVNRSILLAFLMATGCGLTWATGCEAPSDIVLGTLGYASVSESGSFSCDNTEQNIYFYEPNGSANILLQTTSWAAGDFFGDTGGFEPVLTLYDFTTGAEIASDNNGGFPPNCGVRGPGYLGTCLDAAISIPLASSTDEYLLVVTEWGNIGPSTYSADGFALSADSSFASVYNTADGSEFLRNGVDYTQADSGWAVNVDAAPPQLPEPVSGLLGLSGLLFMWGVGRYRSGRASSRSRVC